MLPTTPPSSSSSNNNTSSENTNSKKSNDNHPTMLPPPPDHNNDNNDNKLPSFKTMSQFCRDFLLSKSSPTIQATNSSFKKITSYRGFPSTFHAEAFFFMVDDRLGCSDCHTFLNKYEILKNPSGNSIALMKQIKKKSLDQLQNFVKSKNVTVSIFEQRIEFIKRIPFAVIHGRYTPHESAFLLLAWSDYLLSVLQKFKYDHMSSTNNTTDQFLLTRIELVNKLRKALSWRIPQHQTQTFHQYMKDSKITEFSSNNISNKISFMNDKFKPLITLPKLDLEKINKILASAELPIIVSHPQNLSEYNSLLDTLEQLAGVSGSSVTYRLRKRKGGSQPTKTAVYSPTLDHVSRRCNLPASLMHFRQYNKLLDLCGRLRGRLSSVSHPYITGVATRVDKSGMATFIFKDEHYMFDENSYHSVMNDIDIPSIIFTCMAVSLFSVRKGFTLRGQMQGKLDDFLLYVLDICMMRTTQTKWELISSVYPMENIVSNLVNEEKLKLLSNFLDLQIPMAFFLQKQYEIGVKYCIDKGMSVPKSGTTSIDSTGYNAVVGAWNNSIRFIRMITKTMDQPPPLLLKCMKLTAADQMKMFSIYGMGEHADVALFIDLVKKNITPWGLVIGSCKITREEIIELCKKFKIDPNTWLGYTNYRISNSMVFNDMICGCVVPESSIAQVVLKKLKAYGYKSHKKIVTTASYYNANKK